MAKRHLNKIFLSASIPSIERDEKFYKTADILAVRDAVRALSAVVIPNAHLIWGGHPSITPLIRFVMEKMSSNLKQHVTLYQSLFYEDKFPVDNFNFENIVLTENKENSQVASLKIMREQMIRENEFKAGIFIGGMEGIFEEFDLFNYYHPNAVVLPIASTGAAAKILFNNFPDRFNSRLTNDYAYMALFRELLAEITT